MAAKKETVTVENGGEAPKVYGGKPADIEGATEFDPSGAPRQTTEIDRSHPAVDDNPRAGTTTDQNRADFNDPTLSGSEAVERNLKAQVGETPAADGAKG